MNKPTVAHVRFNTNKIIMALGTVGPIQGKYTLKLIDRAIRVDNLSVSFKTEEGKSIVIVKTNDGSCDISSAYRDGHIGEDAILYAIKKKGYILTEESVYIRKMTDAEVVEFKAATTEQPKDVTTTTETPETDKEETNETVDAGTTAENTPETNAGDINAEPTSATIENVNQVNTVKKGTHRK